MLLADTFPGFGWGASGYLLEGGAEAAFAGKSCSEADLLNGGVGGFQQEFCVVHTGGDDISVRGKTGFLLKQPAEIKGA